MRISGFKETTHLGRYLGVPLLGRAPKRNDFQYLVDRVEAKLSGWKAKQLSFAGRVTLAKSVLEAVPIYPMMTSKIPKSCLEDIQRIQRSFIWGDTEGGRKFHAVSWDKVTTPKWMGGLGLRNLECMNQACLSKLGWKLFSGADDYWCQIMRGDGRDIEAWNHVWIEENLVLMQHITIPQDLQGAKVCDLVDENGCWNWNLMRDWMPLDLQHKIAAILPPHIDNGSDELAGAGGKSTEFSVSSMYYKLRGYSIDGANTIWSKIWKLHVPER
ncbi:putative ribonuclease H protein, partial [Trifolium medium]|nr:putative ribonuclease H protein [Trifolium medium]